MEEILQRLSVEMAQQRRLMPHDALRKFDIERDDVYKAICAAVADADQERAAVLYDRWLERVQILRNVPQSRNVPPCLIRRDGETPKEYLDRIMEVKRA